MILDGPHRCVMMCSGLWSRGNSVACCDPWTLGIHHQTGHLRPQPSQLKGHLRLCRGTRQLLGLCRLGHTSRGVALPAKAGKDWKGHKIIRVTSCHVRLDSWIEVDGGQRYDRIHKRIREDPGYNWSILKVAIQVAGEIDGFVHLRVQVETNAACAAVPLACHAVPLPTLRHPWVTQTTGRTARDTI